MPETHKILLLGDSIRMSYQPHVARMLGDKAEVLGPEENGQYSLYTLSSLGRWIEGIGENDIVHWNNGLHDAGHNPSRSPVQIPIDMYRANLAFILRGLKAVTPSVIWATTTPVHPEKPFKDTEWAWRNEEIDQYNAVATELMESEGIRINDLHSLVSNNVAEFLDEDQLHLSAAGQKACAQAVLDVMTAMGLS